MFVKFVTHMMIIFAILFIVPIIVGLWYGGTLGLFVGILASIFIMFLSIEHLENYMNRLYINIKNKELAKNWR